MTTTQHPAIARPELATIIRAIAKRSFCTLATVSPAGRPHAAGVIYAMVDDDLWFSTHRASRKARNMESNANVHIGIAVRRLPVGPPSTIHFASTAEVVGSDHDQVRAHVASGRLRSITSHGELELPGGCFVRVPLGQVIHTYGLGMSLRALMRDPLGAGGVVHRPRPIDG